MDKLRQAAEQRSDSEHMEPVAWSVFDKRTKKHWYTHESRYTAQHYANEYSHREPDGTPHNIVVPLYTAPQPAKPAEQEPFGEVAEVAQGYDEGWTAIIETGLRKLQKGDKVYTAPQPKAEPVGTYYEVMQTMLALQTGTLEQKQAFALLKDKSLYAAPQPRREPLAYEEITEISRQVAEGGPDDSIDRFVRAIEAAHGITGDSNGNR